MPDGSGDVLGAKRRDGAWRRFALAVTFLTSIPLKIRDNVTPADLWASMGWYPLVGLAMGAAAWGLFAALSWLLPSLVAAALLILLLEAFTRGLHLDGLMDTCDGYFSGAPRERALEIMKDSNVGAMGVAGAVVVVALKVAALGAMSGTGAAVPLIAGWAAARALPPVDVALFPYAREAGTGHAFTRDRTPGPLVAAAVGLAVALALAAVVNVLLGGPAGWWGSPLVVGLALAVPLLVQAAVSRRLGGLTGDVYGMGIELAETTALVAGAALLH